MKIADFDQAHRGKRLLILGNGQSAKQYELSDIDCPIIGLNQAWRLTDCRYLCMGDRAQYQMLEGEYLQGINPNGDAWTAYREKPPVTIFTTKTGDQTKQYAVRLDGHHVGVRKRFSFDLENEGVYLNNTIASFGFQLAVFMLGYIGTIYLLGIDAVGKSVTGATTPESKFDNQRETMGYIAGILEERRPHIRILNLSSHSTIKVFEKANYGEVFDGAR